MPSVKAIRVPPPSEGAWRNVNVPALYTIPEFIRAMRISRGKFYQMCKSGDGPDFVEIGTRRLISFESANVWVRRHTKQKS
jgi:hypothetical protein